MKTIERDYILLSKKGMKELHKKIANLERKRTEIIVALRELDTTTTHEDRLERVEKLADLDTVESELQDAQNVLAKAKLVPSKRERLKVAIGSVVDLIDQQGRLFRYTIVDSIEADPSDGRISIESPLGSSLIGKTIKDTVELGGALSPRSFQLVSIR